MQHQVHAVDGAVHSRFGAEQPVRDADPVGEVLDKTFDGENLPGACPPGIRHCCVHQRCLTISAATPSAHRSALSTCQHALCRGAPTAPSTCSSAGSSPRHLSLSLIHISEPTRRTPI